MTIKQADLGTIAGPIIGAARAPSGHRMEGAGRGLAAGLGTDLGMIGGWVAGHMGAQAGLGALGMNPASDKAKILTLLATLGGVGVGGYAGFKGTKKLMGQPSWKEEEDDRIARNRTWLHRSHKLAFDGVMPTQAPNTAQPTPPASASPTVGPNPMPANLAPPAKPLVTTNNQPQKPLSAKASSRPPAAMGAPLAMKQSSAMGVMPTSLDLENKQPTLLDRIKKMHKTTTIRTNPVAEKQANPYARAMGNYGGPGMLMAPHLAQYGMGGMGYPPMQFPAQHMGGMGGGMSQMPMTEDQLRARYDQEVARIEGSGGSPAQIAARRNSLDTTTSRALQMLRQHDPSSGGGGVMPRSSPRGNPYVGRGGYPGIGMGMYPGMHPSMMGGMGMFPGARYGFGGGMSPLSGVSPVFGTEARSDEDRTRQELNQLRERSEQRQNAITSGIGAPVSAPDLERRFHELQQLANNTSREGGATDSVLDPRTGQSTPISFGDRQLGSGEGGVFGLGWNTSDQWRQYRMARDRYNRDATAYHQWAGQQRQMAQRTGIGSQREQQLEAQLPRYAAENEEDRQLRRQQNIAEARMRTQAMGQMFGVQPGGAPGGSPAPSPTNVSPIFGSGAGGATPWSPAPPTNAGATNPAPNPGVMPSPTPPPAPAG